MKKILKKIVPEPWWTWMRNHRRLRFGSFRRTTPISYGYGMERGTPIDRFYIERFLEQNKSDIRGHVLEFADNIYTRQFGGDRVRKSDIWHATPRNPKATIVGDLVDADHVDSNQFDCIICTQVLMCIYDVPAALRTLHRILKPGGVLLITLPGIAQILQYDMEKWGDYWRFTGLALERLLGDTFPDDSIVVESHGNVMAAMGYLHGLAQSDLRPHELEHNDPNYQFVLSARVAKHALVETPPLVETQPVGVRDVPKTVALSVLLHEMAAALQSVEHCACLI